MRNYYYMPILQMSKGRLKKIKTPQPIRNAAPDLAQLGASGHRHALRWAAIRACACAHIYWLSAVQTSVPAKAGPGLSLPCFRPHRMEQGDICSPCCLWGTLAARAPAGVSTFLSVWTGRKAALDPNVFKTSPNRPLGCSQISELGENRAQRSLGRESEAGWLREWPWATQPEAPAHS